MQSYEIKQAELENVAFAERRSYTPSGGYINNPLINAHLIPREDGRHYLENIVELPLTMHFKKKSKFNCCIIV